MASPTVLDPDQRARLQELFQHLGDERGSVAPIGPEQRAARRARLARLLADHGHGAYLVEPGATLRYLTGIEWYPSERLFAGLFTADGKLLWIVPGFEVERARTMLEAPGGPGGEIVPWQEHEHPYAPLAAALEAAGVETVAVEEDVRQRFVHGLARAFGEEKVLSDPRVLVALRGCKEEAEIAIMRRANELTQKAIAEVAARLEAGMTSTEIAAMVTVAQERMGFKNIWNLTLIGPAAAYPHGEDRVRTLERGDLLLIDTGGSFHGYQSDNTRTWVFDGTPSQRVERIWNTVRDAQKAAYEALAPGRECREVDRAARAVIAERGFGEGYEAFSHRVGHGIGTETHEAPYCDGGSRVILAPGMTFSNEPGIYLPGELGLRIEDIVLVTEDGHDHFGTWQKGPGSPE